MIKTVPDYLRVLHGRIMVLFSDWGGGGNTLLLLESLL